MLHLVKMKLKGNKLTFVVYWECSCTGNFHIPDTFETIVTHVSVLPNSWKPFNFSKEQVRILLFRECDWRGRKLLFDSKAVQKVPLDNRPCSKLKFGSRQKLDYKKTDSFVEVTNGFGYQVRSKYLCYTLL